MEGRPQLARSQLGEQACKGLQEQGCKGTWIRVPSQLSASLQQLIAAKHNKCQFAIRDSRSPLYLVQGVRWLRLDVYWVGWVCLTNQSFRRVASLRGSLTLSSRMAVIALRQNWALPELGNAVIRQKLVWFDSLEANWAGAHMRNTAPEQWLSMNGALEARSGSPVNLGGVGHMEVGHFEARAASGGNEIAQKERQDVLWRDFFLDPTQWWDNRQDKRSSRHPDFRHKRLKGVLWLDNLHKPPWVDAQLALWDAQVRDGVRGSSESTSTSTSGNDADFKVDTWRRLCREGQLTESLRALDLLVQRGSHVDNSLFYCVLKRCITQKDLVLGRRVHVLIAKGGYESDAFLANHTIRMYASHGRLEEATEVFFKVPTPDTYMWASIISAHSEYGQSGKAISLYRRIRQSTVKPNSYIYVAVLKACANAVDVATGKEVHADIVMSAGDPDVFVGSCLVDMYAKCGCLEDARRVFDRLPRKDVVTWTAMIAGYAQHLLGQEALALYASMQQEAMAPANHVTFLCLLQACASVGDLRQGKHLHVQIRERGLEADVAVGNCLVDMYAKCGSLEDARRVFDKLFTKDVVTWNAMFTGYAQHGLGNEALNLYSVMQQDDMTSANRVTFVCLLKACAGAGALHQGRQLHAQIRDRGLECDVSVANCLVDMYAKCGSLDEARREFDRLSVRDVVTWNAMIAGYTQHGLGQEALALYAWMQQDGKTPADHVTFVLLLQVCASVGALHQGRQLHLQIRAKDLETDISIGNCLVDMYAKCGRLDEARRVFDRLSTKDVVTWTALLNGYAEHSDGYMAMQCFREMRQEGVEPDTVAFSCLLVACSHEGLLNEAQRYFRMMVEDHAIAPTSYHYSCMIDVLGRCGQLDDAEDLLLTMPLDNDVVGWTALLSACKTHSDIERGRRCFNRLVALEPENATAYVLLGNLYANAGRWTDVDRIESLRKSAGAWKKPARAFVEVNNKMHEFTVGEERTDVSSKVRSMNLRMKQEGGHVPQTELVLKAFADSEKEDALCGHAEKLALAYGLLNTPDGTPLLVTKNLRMCNDCHSSTKIMSHLEKREIVVRDAHRVHHFVDGSCSCADRH